MKKILSLLLVLLLSACSVTSEEPSSSETVVKDGSTYLSELIAYEPREKNKENTVDDASFDAFQDDVFVEYVSADYIEMRAFLLDYVAYGITKPEVKWPSLQYGNTDRVKVLEEELEELSSFDYSKLSYTQQFEYEKLEYYLKEKICGIFFSKYDLLFSRNYDLLYYLFFNLDEFSLDSEEYVQDYLVLLADTPRYLDDALAFTAAQAENGLYTDNSSIDYSYDYALQLVGDEEDNDLISSFNKRIDKVTFLSEEEKEAYKEQNAAIVKEQIVPAWQKVADTLIQYYDKAEDGQGLCARSEDYARYQFLLNTSSSKDPEELLALAWEEFDKLAALYKEARADETVIAEYEKIYSEDTYDIFRLNDEEMLNELVENTGSIVPKMDTLYYTISRLDAIGDGSSIVAYHIQPALDNLENTIIRTNPNMMGTDVLDDFTTIAHEGVPGHMYQYQYYMASDPADITNIYTYIGYKEGWATYAMFEALDITEIENEGVKTIAEFAFLRDFYLCAIGDICFNYYGNTVEEFAAMFSEHGLNEDYAPLIADIVLANSGTNEQYGLGHIQFKVLKDKAMEALGDKFDEVQFNKELLIHGPLPMAVLEKAVDDFIAENQ